MSITPYGRVATSGASRSRQREEASAGVRRPIDTWGVPVANRAAGGAAEPAAGDCPVVSPRASATGRQGLAVAAGISAETVGARGICLHLVTIPPGGRGFAHLHEGHETAIYAVSGVAETCFGPNLEGRATVRAGDFHYIPAGVPHLPFNASADEPFVAVIARTDPKEQESVVLLPELEAAADGASGAGRR